MLPASSLDSRLPLNEVHHEANELANTFIRRYALELGYGSATIAEETILYNRVFDVFVQLLQLPIDVPENELVRQLAPSPSSLPPIAGAQRRVVSAPERLITRPAVLRPQTMEERVAALAERDRMVEGLWQDEDVDPDNGVDDTQESADFGNYEVTVGEFECQMGECGQKFESVDKLSHHYDREHPVMAEEEEGKVEGAELKQNVPQDAEADGVAKSLAEIVLDGGQSDETDDRVEVKTDGHGKDSSFNVNEHGGAGKEAEEKEGEEEESKKKEE
jgi:hypothetical protein